MKYVIPAKRGSNRVPNKNFRPFADGKSLLDILVTKLIRIADDPADVYLSSEDETTREVAAKYGASFLPREAHLTENSYPFQSVVNQVCAQLPGDDDVMWCHATDPLFDDHAAVVKSWESRDPESADSIVVVYPMKDYLLDSNFNPMGFGFGPWHRPSQQLPVFYMLGFTCSIMTRSVATNIGLVGAKPMWHPATNLTIDIDTQDEFDFAAKLYELAIAPPAGRGAES
ncbi:cytidylyltransferase domain-containing protein [Nocardia sp. NPDC005978]|uniref:cytidylyltransferase domain-containing protein n=1 Tax=unclassified Nocardia TaxID=2637762 RepID=UPI0033B7FC21